MDRPPPRLASALLILSVTFLVIGGLSVLLWSAAKVKLRERDEGATPSRLDYDIDKYKTIDPALIGYRQTAELPTGMELVRAVAVGPEDRIYVVGGRQVRIFRADGAPDGEIALDDEATSIAVAGADLPTPGLIYVGLVHQPEAAPDAKNPPRGEAHVEVYRADRSREATWASVEKGLFTSIAAAEKGVFVADAGNRMVYQYDADGSQVGKIDGYDHHRDEEDRGPGFVIPSPYFDLAMAPDGLLRVVNPGLHHVEAYTLDGHREFFWGEAGLQIERFCGCCNPANFALLPDGRFVTAEKGVPRVKVYSPAGGFECVVAGPELLSPTATAIEETRAEHKLNAVDVACDSNGRVLVLDPAAKVVRVFEVSLSRSRERDAAQWQGEGSGEESPAKAGAAASEDSQSSGTAALTAGPAPASGPGEQTQLSRNTSLTR